MTCSARLPVYALLIGAFVPAVAVAGPLRLQGLVLLGLYLLGALSALAVGGAARADAAARRIGSPSTWSCRPTAWPTARLLATQVWGSARAFLRRAGTIILAVSIVLWVPAHRSRARRRRPARPPPQARALRARAQPGRAHRPRARAGDRAARLRLEDRRRTGREPGRARGDRRDAGADLRRVRRRRPRCAKRCARDVDPSTGQRIYTPATVASLLVFFVFALQCMSTIAVMRRETNGWRWPAFAFGYLLALAWTASFATHRLVDGAGRRLMKRALPAVLIAALLATGCITRSVKEPVFEQDQTTRAAAQPAQGRRDAGRRASAIPLTDLDRPDGAHSFAHRLPQRLRRGRRRAASR